MARGTFNSSSTAGEWCTPEENQNHAFRTGLNKSKPPLHEGSSHYSTKFNESDVLRIRWLYGNTDTTYQKIADEYVVTKSCIYSIVKRKTWKHI